MQVVSDPGYNWIMVTLKALAILLSLTTQVRAIESDLDHAEVTVARTIIVEPAEICIVSEDINGCEEVGQ